MHGGNPGRIARDYNVDPASLTDFSTGINPLGFPAYVRKVISRSLSEASSYPDPEYRDFRIAAGRVVGLSPDHILPGNGTSELLPALLRILKPPRVILPVPCYVDYEVYCRRIGLRVDPVLLEPERDFVLNPEDLDAALAGAPAGSLVLMGDPNNPTGRLLPENLADKFAARYPEHFFCIDEAYKGFTTAADTPSPFGKNILILRSLTKLHGIPGFRLGYLTADPGLIAGVAGELPCWNVGTSASRLAEAIFADDEYGLSTRISLTAARGGLVGGLQAITEITVYPSDANFLLFRLNGRNPDEFFAKMIHEGMLLRPCDDFRGLESGFFRTAIRLEEDNNRLITAMNRVLGTPAVRRSGGPQRPTPSLMFQGTSSNAGKSLMTAAFCRLLSDKGVKVAPFKAQNMSLNSWVTAGGGEIGRAQVLQARAARIEPHVLMNPVLLKPTGDQGSQVILHGKPLANHSAREYYKCKAFLREEVWNAYDELAAGYDAIVLEGAGSPGEVNLKKHDIVNMSMAAYARSPVILVGDIDRGGVYASFIGHMAVMEEWERRLVRGFLVNKFRGDQTLLDDAHTYVEDFTGKPVLGVMPWVRDHRLPEEDGVDFEERYGGTAEEPEGSDIVLGFVDLPRISNSTDLDPFLGLPGIRLVKIDSVEILRRTRPRAVIIPGSKNVIADLEYLRQRGIVEALTKAHRTDNMHIIGICGGFQMLGLSLSDPLGIETTPGSRVAGFGLLPLDTILEKEKTLKQTETTLRSDGSRITGYEIHHGRTNYPERDELFTDSGLGCRKNRVWGTYLHGIFENIGFRNSLLSELRQDAGLAEVAVGEAGRTMDQALDQFTDIFRKSVDVGALMGMMGL